MRKIDDEWLYRAYRRLSVFMLCVGVAGLFSLFFVGVILNLPPHGLVNRVWMGLAVLVGLYFSYKVDVE